MNIRTQQASRTVVRRWLYLSLLALLLIPFRAAQAAPLRQGDLVVELMQTGRGNDDFEVNDELVFRVRAFDPAVGTEDGDGIDFVDMIIEDGDGREVYRKRENDPGYCAFGGGVPNCTVFDFEENDNRWPDRTNPRRRGDPIRSGEEYLLRAVAYSEDGRSADVGFSVQINLTEQEELSDPVVELRQTGVSGQSSEVSDRLVFRVRAFDPAVGNDDGDGIDFVDMIIVDEDDVEVHRRRETTPGYCAFGGGTPNCNVFDFEDNDNRWPQTDIPIDEDEQYRLRAIAVTEDGRQSNPDEMEVAIRINLSSDDDDEPAQATANAVVNTGGGRLRIRSGPGSTYRAIALISNGARFTAVGRDGSNRWLQFVLPNGVRGWVAAQFILLDRPITDLPVVQVGQ
jgi:hypothetical protein